MSEKSTPAPSWGTGRSGLVLAGLMVAFGIYLSLGIVQMNVPESAESPGPTFFPTILAVACFVLAAALVWHYIRTPEAPNDPDGVTALEENEEGPFTDWRTLGLTMLAVLLFAVLLNPLGWILAAALMFWIIAYAMGSPSPLRDIAIAVVLSCAVQVAFSAGLGLHLPAGILEGLF